MAKPVYDCDYCFDRGYIFARKQVGRGIWEWHRWVCKKCLERRRAIRREQTKEEWVEEEFK